MGDRQKLDIPSEPRRQVASNISRRTVLTGMLAGSALTACATSEQSDTAPALSQQKGASGLPDTVVIGAGVFGAWTAWSLQKAGLSVRLIDAWGAGNNLSSSGGESRLIRTEYLGNRLYTGMAHESLPLWQALSDRSGLPIFHECGALYLYRHEAENVRESLALQQSLGIPIERIERADMEARFPQFAFDEISYGIYQPTMGAIMARRSLQVLKEEFLAAGGDFLQARILPPEPGQALDGLLTDGGDRIKAGAFVFACGPWLPKLFPDLVGRRIIASRQEVFFFQAEPGQAKFDGAVMPAWVDAHEPDLHYGFPSLEARGFKIALDRHGREIDPDTLVRHVSGSGEAAVRAYMHKRFPELAGRPLAESRVCQYENTVSGNFLIDRHPDWENVYLVGGGTGHGFKHGPAVGRYVSELVQGTLDAPEPVFALSAHGRHGIGAEADTH